MSHSGYGSLVRAPEAGTTYTIANTQRPGKFPRGDLRLHLGTGPLTYWFCTASRPASATNETPNTRRIQVTTAGREMMRLRTAAAKLP